MNKSKASKRNAKESSDATVFIKGQLLNFITYVIFFLLAGFICLAIGIKKSEIFYVSLAVFCVSGIVCSYISGYKNRKNGLITGLLSVLPSVVVFIIISLLINKFDIDVIRMLISVSLMLISGVFGGVMGVNTRIKPKKRGK